MGTRQRALALLGSFVLYLFTLALAGAMEVHDVVNLVRSGFEEDTIIAIIKKTGAVFHLSEEDRQKLEAAGASKRLMAFIEDPWMAFPEGEVSVEEKPRVQNPSGEPWRSEGGLPPQQQGVQVGWVRQGTQGPKELEQEGAQENRAQQAKPPRPIWNPTEVPQVLEIPPLQQLRETRRALAGFLSRGAPEAENLLFANREVTLTLTVTDREGYYITGLRKEDLRLYENGIPRPILSLTPDQNTPVSVGILLDTSGSMIDKLERAKDALRHFVQSLGVEDEVFLLAFNNRLRMVQDFTMSGKAFTEAWNQIRAGGSTALYDVVAAGLRKVQEGRYRKKALILITDGRDTASERSLAEVVDLARRSGVLIYCLGIGQGEAGFLHHSALGSLGGGVSREALQALSQVTGGNTLILQGAHLVGGTDVIDRACQQIAAELRLQYTLRYFSAGKGRSLRIESPHRELILRARRSS